MSWTRVCAIARSPGRCRLKTNERAPRVSSPRTAQQSHARDHEPSGSEPPVTVRRNLGGVARQHLQGLEERACLDVLRHCPSFKIPLRVRVGGNRMNRPHHINYHKGQALNRSPTTSGMSGMLVRVVSSSTVEVPHLGGVLVLTRHWPSSSNDSRRDLRTSLQS